MVFFVAFVASVALGAFPPAVVASVAFGVLSCCFLWPSRLLLRGSFHSLLFQALRPVLLLLLETDLKLLRDLFGKDLF